MLTSACNQQYAIIKFEKVVINYSQSELLLLVLRFNQSLNGFPMFLVRQHFLNMSGQSLRSGDWVILSTLLGGAALLFFLSTMAQSLLAPDKGQVLLNIAQHCSTCSTCSTLLNITQYCSTLLNIRTLTGFCPCSSTSLATPPSSCPATM